MKKNFTFKALAIALCLGLSVAPASAQFKKLGKNLGKVAKDAGKAVADAAGDMAEDAAANAVSDKLVNFLDQQNKVADENNDYTKRLNSIVANMASGDSKALNYKVYLSDEANIIPFNNGSIRIYSGMMDLLSDEELQALIATEIGYIESGAVRSNLMKVATGDNATNAATAQLQKMLSMSGDKIGTVVNELLLVPYSAKQNQEANSFASKYLKSKKMDTSSLNELANKFNSLRTIDLEDENLDEEDANVIKAQMLSKFLTVTAN